MRNTFFLLFTCLLLVPVVGQAQVSPTLILPEQVKNVWLVQAEVINVQQQENLSTSTLKITHTYSGPPSRSLVGQTFVVYSRSGEGSGIASVTPSPTKGEKGIWSVQQTQEGLVAYLGERSYGFDAPVRKGITPGFTSAAQHVISFDQAEQIAIAIEQAANSNPEEAKRRLRDYAISSNPDLSAWAIQSLGLLLDSTSYEKFLKQLLSNTSVPVKGRAAVDEELFRVEREKWPSSPERMKLLETTVGQKLSDDDVTAVIQWLKNVSGIDQGALLELVKVLVKNEEISAESRRSALTFFIQIATDAKQEAAAFDFLITEIRESQEQDFKVIIAESLSGFRLSRKQVVTVQKLKTELQDVMVIAALETVLQSAPPDARRHAQDEL